MYNVMLGPTAKIDDRQSAEDMCPCSSYGCPRPAQPTTEHLSCLPGRFAYSSTEASEDEQDRSILHSTPAHIPIAHSSDIERLALQDEAEWDDAILWLYIEKYYEAAVHNNSIMPRDLLDNVVHQFLIDRECWDKRSSADIDISIVFLVFSIGKMYAKRQSDSSIPSCQPIGPNRSTTVPGCMFFKLGKDLLDLCSPTPLQSARANALIGLYLHQRGSIPESIEYFTLASQFARDLLRP